MGPTRETKEIGDRQREEEGGERERECQCRCRELVYAIVVPG